MATIFMLHRVHDFEKNKLPVNENMKITPKFLESFIVELKSEGYSFISLDRLHEILQNNETVEKQAVFTLDDGYKDNYDYAYPIFKKYKIPFTIYITTSFPEKNAILWWYEIEDLIMKHDEIILSNNAKYTCKSIEQKTKAFLEIRALIISLQQKNLLSQLNNLFDNYDVDWAGKCYELTMNWAQIKELSKDEMVTIASHTTHHYALRQLDDDECKSEIKEANKLIELRIGGKVEHFAYPFGGVNEVGTREFNLIKSLGLKTAVTTRVGGIYPEHKDFPELLPRIMLTEDFKVRDVGRVRRKRVAVL
jgi:peptidoglycan/xylan/chitin deacetylase (PgdA/CDA1 family)